MANRANKTPQNRSKAPAASNSRAYGVPAAIMGPRLLIVVSAFALTIIGIVMVYSASSIESISETGDASYYLVKELAFTIVGVVGCVLITRFIPYHAWLGTLTWVVWGIAVLLLLATAAIGTVGLGAQRWLNLGPVGLQPSEFAKIAFVLMMAKLLHEFRDEQISMRRLALSTVLLILVPLLILYRTQSDLGTTLICFVGILAILWFSEVPLSIIVAIIAGGLVFAAAASLVGYRQDRFIFLDPWSDPYGSGYQLIHSFYAFSEGGIFGSGLGNSAEKYLYLPEAETDFIFAIIGEELGMIGAFAVVGLFITLLIGGLRTAEVASDGFGTILAGSLTTMIVFQAFLNIGCVIGLLPTTGKPLPFISAGGSSLIASLWMVGIILSVSREAENPVVYEQRRQDLRVIRASSAEGESRRGGTRRHADAAVTSSGARPSRSRPVSSGERARSSGSASARRRKQ